MKRWFYIALSLFLTVAPAHSQRPNDARASKNPDVFQLGTRSVRIPSPTGFSDVIGRIENDHGRFAPDEQGGLLSLDVPDDILPALAKDTLMPLEIYAKVRISPEIMEVDITPELYAATVAEFQKNFDALLDPNGKIVTTAKRDVSLYVSQVTGRVSKVDISATKNLGYFQKTGNVFSALTLMMIEVNGQTIPMLASISLLRLNIRLINATVYKRMPTDKDIETMPEFTKSWTTRILDANK